MFIAHILEYVSKIACACGHILEYVSKIAQAYAYILEYVSKQHVLYIYKWLFMSVDIRPLFNDLLVLCAKACRKCAIACCEYMEVTK